MVPPLLVSSSDADHLHATVRFGPFHGGFGDHVHGGAVALVLNEALGALANSVPGTVRVALSVEVGYRAAAVLDRLLTVQAKVTSSEGRKQTIHVVLTDGDRVIAEATGLFLALRSPTAGGV